MRATHLAQGALRESSGQSRAHEVFDEWRPQDEEGQSSCCMQTEGHEVPEDFLEVLETDLATNEPPELESTPRG